MQTLVLVAKCRNFADKNSKIKRRKAAGRQNGKY